MKSLRILHIINSLNSGGAEKLLVEVVNRMASLGQQADVLLLSGRKTHLFDLFDTTQRIQVHVLEGVSNIYNPSCILKIRKFLGTHSYDVIHVHLFPSMYWAAGARKIGTPMKTLVYTEHNTTNRRRKLYLYKLLDRFMYRAYDRVITISDAVDASLKAHVGSRFNHLVKIYNGIDLEKITQALPYSKTEMGIKAEDIAILQVSSFTPQKDQQTLIRAMRGLPESHHLFLVGDGPTREKSKALAASLKLEDRVHFMGIRSDVPRLLKTVDLVALSSHFEGLSLSSVEGMASGKPFLASDVPGLTEVVQNAGILFPDGDHETLAAEIRGLMADPTRYREVAGRCQEKSLQYTIQRMVDRYLELYRTCLESER